MTFHGRNSINSVLLPSFNCFTCLRESNEIMFAFVVGYFFSEVAIQLQPVANYTMVRDFNLMILVNFHPKLEIS